MSVDSLEMTRWVVMTHSSRCWPRNGRVILPDSQPGQAAPIQFDNC